MTQLKQMTSSLAGDLAFSHFGFFVHNLEAMAHFYKEALRFTQTDSGVLGPTKIVFLSRDPKEHHQIVLMAGRPDPLVFNVINQISFRVPDLQALRKYHSRVLKHGATDMHPVTHGNAISIYFRDPEGNRLEIFMDTDWYCDQPLREPIDLADTDEEIIAQTELVAKRFPKFKLRSVWQQEMAARMSADQAI